jgi:hypothetical protein
MKSNELSLNRLTEGQSVPRPHFGDASIVFDSDGVFKYIDGNDGASKLIYPPIDILFLLTEARFGFSYGISNPFSITSIGTILDFSILGPYFDSFSMNSQTTLTTINGASKLTAIRDEGTSSALSLQGCSFSVSELNKLFTELPVTTRTATIKVNSNPGSATCTPSIATAKGYTVVT